MLTKLTNDIQENSVVIIKGKPYAVLAKSIYSPMSDLTQTYAKVVLSDHFILVIVPYLDFVCIGHIENVFGEGKEFPDAVTFGGIKYEKLDEDYQIVRRLVFGDPRIAEGEVSYADYGNDKSNISISLGFVSRNNERADVIQEILSIDDIEVR